jgi:hypothetical protein
MKMETPSSKSQVPRKLQVTNFQMPPVAKAALRLEVWDFFGLWNLEIGAF